MGEAGSLGASPGPSHQPSCEPESVPGLLSVPPEILGVIIDALPRRCLPYVRLVCRKLEAAAEMAMRRLQIQIDASPRGVRPHRIFTICRTLPSAHGSRDVACVLSLCPVQHRPSTRNTPNCAAPGWSKHVVDLHLTLRIDSPPEPQPNHTSGLHHHAAGAPPDVQVQEEDVLAAMPAAPPLPLPDGAALLHALQLPAQAPGHNVHALALPLPAQPHPPAQPPALAALAQAFANQLQQLLLQEELQNAMGLAAGPQLLMGQVEALLAAAAGPPMQEAVPWVLPAGGPPLLNPAAFGLHPAHPAPAVLGLLPPPLNPHPHQHQHPPAGPQGAGLPQGAGGMLAEMAEEAAGQGAAVDVAGAALLEAVAAQGGGMQPEQQAAAQAGDDDEAGQGEDGDGDGGAADVGLGPPGPMLPQAVDPHVVVWMDLMGHPQHPPPPPPPHEDAGAGAAGDVAIVAADADGIALANQNNNGEVHFDEAAPQPEPDLIPPPPAAPHLPSAVRAAAAAAADHQARRRLHRAETSIAIQLYAMSTNLLPALHNLRTLRLDHVPPGCMAAAGALAAAAPSLAALRILRTETESPAHEAAVPDAARSDVLPHYGDDWEYDLEAAQQELAVDGNVGGGADDDVAAATHGAPPQPPQSPQPLHEVGLPADHPVAAALRDDVAVGVEEEGDAEPPKQHDGMEVAQAEGAEVACSGVSGGEGNWSPAGASDLGRSSAGGSTSSRPRHRRMSPEVAAAVAAALAASTPESFKDDESENSMLSAESSFSSGDGSGRVAETVAALTTGGADAVGRGVGGSGGGGDWGIAEAEAEAETNVNGFSYGPGPSGSNPQQRPPQGYFGLLPDPDGMDSDSSSSSSDGSRDIGGCYGWEGDDVIVRGCGGRRKSEVLFWSRVASLPRLQSLTLQGGSLRPVDMAGLVALTGLRELSVIHVINTHPGLACLASLTCLTRLVIEDLQYVGGAIHDEFCGLSRLTGLRSLSFLVVGPLPAEVMAWGALTGLTQLEITNHYDEHLLPCFSVVLPRLQQLASLNLSNFDINNALLAALRRCTHLTSLQMGRFNVTAPCTDVMKEVRVLHLAFVDDIQRTEVPLVDVFPGLTELALATRFVLNHESAQRIPLELLPPSTQSGRLPLPVTRLYLYDALMCASLPVTLPSLTSLRLDWNQTETPLLLSYMAAWGHGLTSLQWAHCDALEDAGLGALTTALPKLTQLELARPLKLTNTGLMALSALSALTELTLAGAPQLTSAGLAPLVPQLSNLARLTLRDMAGVEQQAAWALEDLSNRHNGLAVSVLPKLGRLP